MEWTPLPPPAFAKASAGKAGVSGCPAKPSGRRRANCECFQPKDSHDHRSTVFRLHDAGRHLGRSLADRGPERRRLFYQTVFLGVDRGRPVRRRRLFSPAHARPGAVGLCAIARLRDRDRTDGRYPDAGRLARALFLTFNPRAIRTAAAARRWCGIRAGNSGRRGW
jgi:hypothetical protein